MARQRQSRPRQHNPQARQSARKVADKAAEKYKACPDCGRLFSRYKRAWKMHERTCEGRILTRTDSPLAIPAPAAANSSNSSSESDSKSDKHLHDTANNIDYWKEWGNAQ
ncbi:hypothetical protein FRC08_015041, partial [Ceratobasidium sp. 394]